MRTSPRIRTTIKWTSAAMAVVTMFAWAASTRWEVSCYMAPWGLEMGIGRQGIGYEMYLPRWPIGFPNESGWSVNRTRSPMSRDWWFLIESRPNYHVFVMPLWFPVFIFCGLWLDAWWLETRSRRRDARAVCVACGYDRAGLKDEGSACPECGKPPPPAPSPRASGS